MGLAGLVIIEDGTGERLGLPRSYGVDDLPIILQDRQFDRTGAPPSRRVCGCSGQRTSSIPMVTHCSRTAIGASKPSHQGPRHPAFGSCSAGATRVSMISLRTAWL
jgi:FtsP/CotA-like multicopper oxidase with cupredoxin domain